MSDTAQRLPSGTVTLLFSDIEGSTALLSRLGPAYADALDGQRDVMRRAWATNDGVELGTEGDSFYVVFESAPQAVAAAAQAQRELAGYAWPGDESVRVRIGMHTGTPDVHGDAYVGMDVHRAARIAGAAHGGQVVLSSTTAALTGSALPDRTRLDDLGTVQLKDLPMPERVFQLTLDGLPAEFPALRSLGAASQLPSMPGPLVGRDDEIAEALRLIRDDGVRLVTLTGPGGTGKTRLAIAIAERLATSTPGGVYFVPLAMDTTEESAWDNLADQLDVPASNRSPDALLATIADRHAVYVLDNLEQLASADDLVTRLLGAAPRAVVVATSRRPLHTPAEHERPVPPLDLPSDDDLADAETAAAVQLFAQHARRAQPRFAITSDNAADVVALCRRLDGLPLAIELIAARCRVLSPKAMLSRLDKLLDLSDGGRQRPERQRTLRDTITASYELLTPSLQAAFRAVGAFHGGADLAAVEAVALDPGDDALDVVAELADASLITVSEGADGEPRVAMLETIRAYAKDLQRELGEHDALRMRHALHYADVVAALRQLLLGDGWLEARARFETEDANVREAIAWALPDADPGDADRSYVGLRLVAGASLLLASRHGYMPLDRGDTFQRALDRVPNDGSPQHAQVALAVAVIATFRADPNIEAVVVAAVDAGRASGDDDVLVTALGLHGLLAGQAGRIDEGRTAYQESLRVARDSGRLTPLFDALSELSLFVDYAEHDWEESLRLQREALVVARRIPNPYAELSVQHNMACSLRLLGRVEESLDLMRSLVPLALEMKVAGNLMTMGEDMAAILAAHGDAWSATVLFGAAAATRQQMGMPMLPAQQATLVEPLAKTRSELGDRWQAAYDEGHGLRLEDALRAAYESTA